MKNPGVDRFFSIFQVRKYLISITFIPHEGFFATFLKMATQAEKVFLLFNFFTERQ